MLLNYVPTSYKKWGANLATVGMMNTIFSPTYTNQWRNDQVDLSAYKNKKVFLRFRGHNNKGNNLYIDNINLMLKNAWPLGVNGFDQSQVNVYPNPSNGNYTMELFATYDKMIDYKVFNIAGQQIKHNSLHISSGVTKAALSIEEMPSGIYLLEVSDGERTQRVKLNKY